MSILIVLCLLSYGCKNPFDRTRDASNGGPTGTFGKTPAFVIFSSELQSGGGAFEYPGSDGQSLTFNDTSNPISRRSIRYSWTGQAVINLGCPAQNPTHNFAGFDLMHTAVQADYSATPGRDLSQAGYTKVTFYARGTLSSRTYIKVEVASPGSSDACAAVVSPCLKLIESGQTDPDPAQDATCTAMTISDQWRQYTIPLPGAWLASNRVKDLFKATFIFVDLIPGGQQPGQGGVAYYDNVQYEQ